MHAGEGGARRGLRHDGGRMRRVEGEGGKWRERVVGKAGGDERVFIASSDEMIESDIVSIPNSPLLIEGKLV